MKMKAVPKPTTAQASAVPSDHAVAALKTLLSQVSAIKLREVRIECTAPSREFLIVAFVDVYQHSHTLVCSVKSSDEPHDVRSALAELESRTARLSSNATPVFIAPRVSSQARALCSASRTGFLDLEGNARLHLDDLFIGQRSIPLPRGPQPVAVPPVATRSASAELAGVA
jgi:hypothetical protein